MGFAQNLTGAAGQASLYDQKKNQTLIQGSAERNRRYAAATQAEEQARAEAAMAGQNMMTMRGNQRRAVASARTAAATRGFTSEGTGGAMAEDVEQRYEKALADMATDASVRGMNAVNRAIALRREGDEVQRAAEVEARLYRRAARETRTGMWVSTAGAVIGAAGGAAQGMAGAEATNAAADAFNQKYAAQIAAGQIKPAQHVSVAEAGFKGGLHATGWGSSMMNAFNPLMSDFTTKGWEEDFLKFAGYAK